MNRRQTVGVTWCCHTNELKGVAMEEIYLYKGKVEEINEMLEELGVSL